MLVIATKKPVPANPSPIMPCSTSVNLSSTKKSRTPVMAQLSPLKKQKPDTFIMKALFMTRNFSSWKYFRKEAFLFCLYWWTALRFGGCFGRSLTNITHKIGGMAPIIICISNTVRMFSFLNNYINIHSLYVILRLKNLLLRRVNF